MLKYIKIYFVSIFTIIGMLIIFDCHASDPDFQVLPKDLQHKIIDHLIEIKNGNAIELARVNSMFKDIIYKNVNVIGSPAWNRKNGVTSNNKLAYRYLLNSRIICDIKSRKKRNFVSDKLRYICTFFDGCLNLSNLPLKTEKIILTTDPSVFFSPNDNKIVILITTHALIKERIETEGKYFQSKLETWNPKKAPIGVFWRCGENKEENSFDSLTCLPPMGISSQTLFQLWKSSDRTSPVSLDKSDILNFKIIFEP